MFKPRLEMLPEPQHRLWDEIGTTPKDFVLYGGTALALRIGHRQSVDFDFFSAQPFKPSELLMRIPYLKGATVQQSSENTLTCLADREGPVQVLFFGGLDLKRVKDPDTAIGAGIKVASLIDLAATKVKVLLDRASYKDYVDIDALIKAGIRLPMALAAAKAVYGPQYNPLLSLKALTYFEEGDVKQLSEEIRANLVRAVQTVDIGKLPILQPKRGLDHEGIDR